MNMKCLIDQRLKKILKKYIEKVEKDLKTLQERNLSILKESKKKKNTNKDLERLKIQYKNQLTVWRVKNGILEKEKADFKIVVEQKVKHIKQLEDEISPDEHIEAEVEIVERQSVLMNIETQDHRCNACNKEFSNSRNLNNHIDAKHNEKVCVFCEKVFTNEQQLLKAEPITLKRRL